MKKPVQTALGRKCLFTGDTGSGKVEIRLMAMCRAALQLGYQINACPFKGAFLSFTYVYKKWEMALVGAMCETCCEGSVRTQECSRKCSVQVCFFKRVCNFHFGCVADILV